MIDTMVKKAQVFVARYKELERLLEAPEVIADSRLFSSLSLEFIALQEVVEDAELLGIIDYNDPQAVDLYKTVVAFDRKRTVKDLEIAEVEITASNKLDLKILLDSYTEFYKANRWQIVDKSKTDNTAVFTLSGIGAYTYFFNEIGLTKINDRKSSVLVTKSVNIQDYQVLDIDIQIDTFRASGKGGQHINKTESAVRAIHKPTGLKQECQSERSQIQNKETAISELKIKVLQFYREKALKEKEADIAKVNKIIKSGKVIRQIELDSEKVCHAKTLDGNAFYAIAKYGRLVLI